MNQELPKIDDDMIVWEMLNDVEVYVPKGSKDAYTSAAASANGISYPEDNSRIYIKFLTDSPRLIERWHSFA